MTVTNAVYTVYSPFVLRNASRLIVIMTKFQAIIDTVLLGFMGLGGLSRVGIDLITSTAQDFIYFKWMYAKYGVHVEFALKMWVYANKECTLNTAITVGIIIYNNIF